MKDGKNLTYVMQSKNPKGQYTFLLKGYFFYGGGKDNVMLKDSVGSEVIRLLMI